MDSIEPFNYKQLVEFSEKYLSGYYADKYDVSLDASAPRANERVKGVQKTGFVIPFMDMSRFSLKAAG